MRAGIPIEEPKRVNKPMHITTRLLHLADQMSIAHAASALQRRDAEGLPIAEYYHYAMLREEFKELLKHVEAKLERLNWGPLKGTELKLE